MKNKKNFGGWIRQNAYMTQNGKKSIYYAKAKLLQIEAAEIAVADISVVSGMVREALRMPESMWPETFAKTDQSAAYFRFPGIQFKANEAEKFESLPIKDRVRVLRAAAQLLLEYQTKGQFVPSHAPYPGTQIVNPRVSAGPDLWVARAALRRRDGGVRVGRPPNKKAVSDAAALATKPFYAVPRDFEGRENETRTLYEITDGEGVLQYVIFAESLYCAAKMAIEGRGERLTPEAIDPTWTPPS